MALGAEPTLLICLTCRDGREGDHSDARPAPLRAAILGRLPPLGTASDPVSELRGMET
jgi:predicted metal-binding protein